MPKPFMRTLPADSPGSVLSNRPEREAFGNVRDLSEMINSTRGARAERNQADFERYKSSATTSLDALVKMYGGIGRVPHSEMGKWYSTTGFLPPIDFFEEKGIELSDEERTRLSGPSGPMPKPMVDSLIERLTKAAEMEEE